MDQNERKEIQEAIYAADDALFHLDSARKCLGSTGQLKYEGFTLSEFEI